jgi:hypothetical protein
LTASDREQPTLGEGGGYSAASEDLFGQIKRFNRSGDATMVVPSQYLEVVVTRR